ncbi:MAG: YdcF family protein [Terriglobia bacterium]|jgi:uncharacterized SAM-binding protein YcdF (DUF218 family)
MRVKGVGRRLLIVLAVLAVLIGTAFWAFRNVGRWLVVDDTLQPARAILVLSDSTPYRAMEAANIYRQGLAPEIWLTRDYDNENDNPFARLGIHHISEEDYNQQVLERLRVPTAAVRLLDLPATNTTDEEQLFAKELRRVGGDRIILVTSPVHTRRVKTLWHILVGNHPEAIVRYSAYEPFDPAHWWRATKDDDVGHEVSGLLNARNGFVAKPRK